MLTTGLPGISRALLPVLLLPLALQVGCREIVAYPQNSEDTADATVDATDGGWRDAAPDAQPDVGVEDQSTPTDANSEGLDLAPDVGSGDLIPSADAGTLLLSESFAGSSLPGSVPSGCQAPTVYGGRLVAPVKAQICTTIHWSELSGGQPIVPPLKVRFALGVSALTGSMGDYADPFHIHYDNGSIINVAYRLRRVSGGWASELALAGAHGQEEQCPLVGVVTPDGSASPVFVELTWDLSGGTSRATLKVQGQSCSTQITGEQLGGTQNRSLEFGAPLAGGGNIGGKLQIDNIEIWRGP